MRIEISACFCQSWIFKLKGRGHRQSQAKDIQLSWDSSLDLLVISRCPVRCPDWSCSQSTCSKYHGESYDNLYFFQIDATFFCRSIKVLT